MKRIIFVCFSLVLLLILPGHGFAAEQDWRQEFARICSKTGEAAQLSGPELDSLINDSEKLLSVIELKDDPDVKLYLIRTRKCRDFFIFMRDTVENGS